MAAPHLLAHCDDAVCVAEDNAVSFFAPKSLTKYRVERLNGFRISGLYMKYTDGEHHLHVIDCRGNWFVISLESLKLLSSSTISFSPQGKTSASGKPLISARPTAATDDTNNITEAHFCECDGSFYAVLLTTKGVYEVCLDDTNITKGRELYPFLNDLPDCTLAVGRHTGLVVIGQRGERWLRFVKVSHELDGEDEVTKTTGNHILPIALQSVCCSPSEPAVAVGGSRGELMLYPDVEGIHYFSDHWHHTPLSAIQFSIDGSSLFTGAMESTLLVWDLRSYTHKKIQLRTGSIRSIITSSSTGGTLVLACNTSTLAVVDLLQQRLAHSVDGIEWQSSGVCSGLVVDNWMGRRVVMLTGLPEVLRVCDPLTQQAIYSLHITSQMEVLPKPPRHGILFTGMLRDGRVIVTYESFGGSALPSLLRFWSYDTNVKSHVEAQIIYAPHQSEVVSLQLDKKKDRVFTLSGDAVKCWEEVKAEATDVHQHIQGDSWRNNSSIPSPSKDVASMLVSPDGSLCFVADDSVYVYGIEHCAPGEAWPLLATLYQGVTTSALSSLTLLEEEQILVSFSASTVFLWTLADRNVHTFRHTQPITSMCQFSAHSVLIADEAGVLTEVAATKNNIGTKVGSVKCPTEGRVEHMELLSAAEGRVAMVDHLSGFRVLNVAIDKDTIGVEEMTPGLNNAEQEHPNRLTEFFKNRPAPQDIEAASVIETQRTAQANQWLHTVLHDSAFALAPMSNVLSQYVRKSTTGV